MSTNNILPPTPGAPVPPPATQAAPPQQALQTETPAQLIDVEYNDQELAIREMNLHQRIAGVMKEVGYIQKDVNVAFGKTKYNAISEAKVTTEVRKFLIKYGLTFLPIKQVVGRRGDVTTIDITYRITNIDNPEQFIDIVASGEGADTQDKGAGKAQTYAYKYGLLRAFAIATGDDPDLMSTEELNHNAAQNQSNHAKLVDEFNNLYANAMAKGHPPVNISQVLAQTLGHVFNSPQELSTQQLNKLIGVLKRY